MFSFFSPPILPWFAPEAMKKDLRKLMQRISDISSRYAIKVNSG
jgi:hypothetical protein